MNRIFRELKQHYSVKQKNSLDFPAHVHGDLELIYIFRGSGTAYCDAVSYELTSGDFFLVFPHQIHWYEGFDKPNCLYFSIIVKAEWLLQYKEVFQDYVPAAARYSHPIDDPDYLLALFQTATLEVKDSPPDVVLAFLTLIFGKLLHHYELQKRSVASDSVSELLRYCSHHYTDPDISIGSAAKALNISESYVSYIFNRRLSIQFRTYINSLRLADAMHLLKHHHYSITDIAGRVGFNTLRTFNRAFFKETGMTPKEYRAISHQNNLEGITQIPDHLLGTFMDRVMD